MDVEGKAIWQIAAGDGGKHHYAKLCLERGVVILGPGRYGAWPDCETLMRDNGWTPRKTGIVRRFAEDLSPGDIVVLRVGTQHVYGVGELVGGYGWSDTFANVQGWDLQHFRRVHWLWHRNGEAETFPPYSLKFGSSVQRLISPRVRRWLGSLDIPEEAYTRRIQAR